jgi:hypothetical protein
MNNRDAKGALDKLISKSRVHLYKPIQIAEILYRNRIHQDIQLEKLSTYRITSKRWRDEICLKLLGRVSTSSSKFQDNLFEENAIPPDILFELGRDNKIHDGIVEAYIYIKFAERFQQMSAALLYCQSTTWREFEITEFLSLFRQEPGLRRSIDKIYEIIVYALFSVLLEILNISVEISIDPEKEEILAEFSDFTKQVINLSLESPNLKIPAKVNRVGITNAADRGLDMWSNFGLAIQIKHLSLDPKIAEGIVSGISADRIVIVCKDSEEKTIVSLLNQIGWRSRIQSIITEKMLITWYEKALRGKYSEQVGLRLVEILQEQIKIEFPSTESAEITQFMLERGYPKLMGEISRDKIEQIWI